jgi:nickel-dependent lactate racemase
MGQFLARYGAIEFARMAKLDFSVHCMMNHKAEAVAIFAGDVEQSQKVAISFTAE